MIRVPLTMPDVQPPTHEELIRVTNVQNESAANAAANSWFDQYAADHQQRTHDALGLSLAADASSSAQQVPGSPIANGIDGFAYFDPEAVKDDNNADVIWKDNDFRAWLQSQADLNDARSRALTDYNYDKMREFRSTAYQDTVADLRAAGLNPVLAYSNGANSSSNGYSSAAAVNGSGANSSLDNSTVKDMMSAYFSLIGSVLNSSTAVFSRFIRQR